MDVTVTTWVIALVGIGLLSLLSALQLVAVFRPRSKWTIDNVYGGSPDDTDPKAYFAFNQACAWADPFLWAPLQIVGSVGMLLGERWGFLLRSRHRFRSGTPPCSSTSGIATLGFRQPTFNYWVVIWGMWPAFGVVEGVYCFVRLLE